GAEEAISRPEPPAPIATGRALEVLFYGSFIPLQAPQVVVEAARLYEGPPVKWVLLGQGPLRKLCEESAQGLGNVSFEGWLPYEQLPDRIHRADVLLGVFGTTPKAGRVIPNKVFQSLACGRTVVTRSAVAYPEALLAARSSGLLWTEPGNAQSLTDCVATLAADSATLRRLDEAAAETSQQYFSESVVRNQLNMALQGLTA
ncbi:MAG: glycosyltransferase, partial [Anderseniella sp.]|nr:glycosyltransferase [Anderseniella sp.]